MSARRGRDPGPARAGSRATAHGKVILLGEHGVVHGGSAIAAAIERGAHATLRVLPRGQISRISVGARTWTADPVGEDVARAFFALLRRFSAPPVEVRAVSDLPAGGGLGSSAALGVAIARAVELACAHDVEPSGADPSPSANHRMLERANAWEEVFHGSPSGIDATTAARGGCLRFSRADGARPLPLARALWLCVGDSGRGSSTRAMVERVARIAQREPFRFRRTMDFMEQSVARAAAALEAGDLGAVGALMNGGQQILADLTLSTDAIDALCAAARAAGALGAKLTGAGGGGSVVALAPPAAPTHDDDGRAGAHAIVDAWRAAGLDGFVTRVPSPDPELTQETS